MIWLLLTASAAPLALDAGSQGGEVFEGFSRLGPVSCEAPGCSWVTPPRGFRADNQPDPLAGDWVRAGKLHLDLPPGEYLGWAMLGTPDAALSYEPQTPLGGSFGITVDDEDVFREQVPDGLEWLQSKWRVGNAFPQFGPDLTEWDRQIASVVEWTPFTFTADEDGVDIKVDHIALQALVVVPEAERAEGEVIVEAARNAQRIWYHDYVNQSAATWPAPDLGEGPMSVQFTGWRDIPDATQASAKPELYLEGFRGTRTGRIAWLFGSDAGTTFTVEGLDGLEVETGEVHWLDVRGDYELTRRPRPAFVRPSDGELRGNQGATVGLAFTVIVPEDARPRTYEGVIHVVRGAETLDIPVVVDVSRLELADHPFPSGYFMDLRPNVTSAYGVGDPRILEVFEEDVRLMRERGMTAIAPRFVADIFPFLKGHSGTFSPGFIDDVTRIWREAGGTDIQWNDGFWAMANTRSFRPPQQIDIEALDMVAEAARRNDVSLFMYDEGGGRSMRETRYGNRISDVLRQRHPAVRIAGALEHPRDWAYSDRYDIVMHTHRARPSAARSDMIRGLGAEAWAYNMMPGRLAPNAAWTMAADGLLTWHWNDNTGSPFSDVDARPDFERSFLAPDGRTVWPSTLANGFGEGIVDIRVLHTLEQEVRRAEERGRDASRGRAILDTVPQMVDDIDPIGPFDTARVHDEALSWIRHAAAEEALRLQRGRRLKPRFDPAPGEIELQRFGVPWIPSTRATWTPNADLPFVTGPTPTPDGVLHELAWKSALPGPALRMASYSKGATTGEMSLLVTDDGLAIGIRDLADGAWGRILVDANGMQQQWVEVEIPRENGPANITRCSWDGDAGPAPRGAAVSVTPCAEIGVPVGARVGSEAEMLIPWDAFDHTNADLSLNWLMQEADGLKSTSANGGAFSLIPGGASTNLDTSESRGGTRSSANVLAGTWNITATVPAPETDEEWVWEVWHFGEIVRHGTVPVAAGQTEVTLSVPSHPILQAWFTMRSPNGGPLHPVAQGPLPMPEFSIAPGTPVSGDYQELTMFLSDTYEDVTIETLHQDEVLATTTTTLARGKASLRITGATGDAVRLTIPTEEGPPRIITVPFVPLNP